MTKEDINDFTANASTPSISIESQETPRVKHFGLPQIAASVIMLLAPCSSSSAAIKYPWLSDTVSYSNNSILIGTATPSKKHLSLKEARQIARKIQEDIDRQYEKEIETESHVSAIWEE